MYSLVTYSVCFFAFTAAVTVAHYGFATSLEQRTLRLILAMLLFAASLATAFSMRIDDSDSTLNAWVAFSRQQEQDFAVKKQALTLQNRILVQTDQARWPFNMTVKHMPKLGKTPKLPIPFPDKLKERVQYLVEQHPDAEIRDDMFSLWDKGGITVEAHISEDDEWYGEFVSPKSGALPTIYLDASMVAKITTLNDVLDAMLVVTHEFQHYKDWRDSLVKPPVAHTTDAPQIAQECEETWKTELNAFSAECLTALSWSILYPSNDACLLVHDDRRFRHAVFNWQNTSRNLRVQPQCLATWAQLAGHPHPGGVRVDRIVTPRPQRTEPHRGFAALGISVL